MDFDRESMLDMFLFEMNQLLESLEQNVIQGESGYSMDQINEIFRIMHTIKGSAAMMLFTSMSTTAHKIEDLFFYLREENPRDIDFSKLTDLVLEAMDFLKDELAKVEAGQSTEGDKCATDERIQAFLVEIKGGTPPPAVQNVEDTVHAYRAVAHFEDGCEMENVRAFTLINNLKPLVKEVSHIPEDIINEASIETIRKDGFIVEFTSLKDYDEMHEHLMQTVYLERLALMEKNGEGNYAVRNCKEYQVSVLFNDGDENVQAERLVRGISGFLESVTASPENYADKEAILTLRDYGLMIDISTEKSITEVSEIFGDFIPLSQIALEEVDEEHPRNPTPPVTSDVLTPAAPPPAAPPEVAPPPVHIPEQAAAQANEAAKKAPPTQHVISVNLSKLDQLLKLMGEIVIAEAMVTQNPELEGLQLDNFHKEARQLRIILKDLQDTVMSMRMVPLSTTFFKMNRIVRDMCKQLNKEVQLDIVGEDTEVDRNIIEHISDPIMHIIRNSIDHGIETPEERIAKGKPEKGRVLLEAKNSGSDILIIIRDDGQGLDRDAIMRKAKSNGLLYKPEMEYSDKEVHQFIFMPGFSTNDVVTSFSGRGVGMDVVVKNLEQVNGQVLVDSVPGEGSTFTLKIPLTLAIIDGMVISMGGAKYIIPIMSIRDSFKPKMSDVFYDPNGNEMITVREECYNVVRLYEVFGMSPSSDNLEDGIMVTVEDGDEKTVCLFVDELLSQQQIVVKEIPKYIKRARGISGCTLLGNGEISLIIDAAGFFDK